MKPEVIIESIVTVVDRTLRREFSVDYERRCAYASTAICTLLNDSGLSAERVGGNFAAFVVTPDSRRAAMQGYGFDPQQPAHFWVQSTGYLIDLGPHYLPRRSSYPVVPMAAAMWPLLEPLPRYLRYQELVIIPNDAQFSSEPAQVERASSFLAQCDERWTKQSRHPKFSHWMLRGAESVERAADQGDLWARSAKRFAAGEGIMDLPF